MNYDESLALYESLKNCGDKNDADWQELYSDYLKSATDYAQERVAWLFLDNKQKVQADSRRTADHNAFIDRLNILSRYAAKKYGFVDTDIIRADRKVIGDFACFIHCFLGLDAR